MSRKLVAFVHLSLDGYACGPKGELEWANVEPEIAADVDTRLKAVGTAVYGRVVYGMMAGYWPTVNANPDSTEHDRAHLAVGQESGKTNHVERWNNTLRQRLRQFVRKTLSFSKCPVMHLTRLKLSIHRYNGDLACSFLS